MYDDPRLLVVDDEEVICQGCRRIFAPQGFKVETSSDALRGLHLATEKDYAVILLDIKMPVMDGIQFVEELRKKKPNAPVIFITGYPSIPNAAAAMRFGAADYITKPFTPADITRAVRRLVQDRDAEVEIEPGVAPSSVERWTPSTEELRFWGEAWLQRGKEGTIRAGAMLTRSQCAVIGAAKLPKIGETVYQGLPLAGLKLSDGTQLIIPAPLSGVTVAVNEPLQENPSLLLTNPCGAGWLACITPERFDAEVINCRPRRVILASTDKVSAYDQSKQLNRLGCQVLVVRGWEELAPTVQDSDYQVLMIDAASFGECGPALVERINAVAPAVKIVVIASPDSKWESAYRRHKIFYYAVDPFGDNEIIDILQAAFCPQRPPTPQVKPLQKTSAESIGRIQITNRNGQNICLLAAGGLLHKDEGLGWQLRRALLDRLYPVETTLGWANISALAILKEVDNCDHLLVLKVKDGGRLPGSLLREANTEWGLDSWDIADKITALVVQPDSSGDVIEGLDSRTTAALAEHIANEMASY